MAQYPKGLKKSEITRQKILDQAEAMFAANGAKGTSLRAIADAVGIKAGTVLHHFPDGKDELYAILIKSTFDHLVDALARVTAGDKAAEASGEFLLHIASALWDYFEANPLRAKLVIREAMEDHSDVFERSKFQARMFTQASQNLLEKSDIAKRSPKLDLEMLMLDAFSLLVMFHIAPGMATTVVDCDDREQLKTRYLNYLSAMAGI